MLFMLSTPLYNRTVLFNKTKNDQYFNKTLIFIHRYEFKADPAGTHYYHSHSGTQREEGLYGAVIVRQPLDDEVHSQLYDHDKSEHTFIVTDWYPQPGYNRFLEINHRRDTKIQALQPLSGLINGKTRRYEVSKSTYTSLSIPTLRVPVSQ